MASALSMLNVMIFPGIAQAANESEIGGLIAYRIQDVPDPENGGRLINTRVRIDAGSTAHEFLFVKGDIRDHQLSPDGKSLFFLGSALNYQPWIDGDKSSGLFILDLKNFFLRQLPGNQLFRLDPSYAQDGSAIAFIGLVGNWPQIWELFVLDLAINKETQITMTGGSLSNPTWSPDKRFIAYRDDLAKGIYQIEVETRKISMVSEVGDQPAWSPDGKTIAYVYDGCFSTGPNSSRCSPEVRGIYLFDTSTKEIRRLSGVCDRSIEWSPDGRSLICIGEDRSGINQIYVVDLETAISIRYDNNSFFEYSISWSKIGDGVKTSNLPPVEVDYREKYDFYVSSIAIDLSQKSQEDASKKLTNADALLAESRKELASIKRKFPKEHFQEIARTYLVSATEMDQESENLVNSLERTSIFLDNAQKLEYIKSIQNWRQVIANLSLAITNLRSTRDRLKAASTVASDTLELIRKEESLAAQRTKEGTSSNVGANVKSTKIKVETLICFKGKVSKKISGSSPKCPRGFKVKLPG